MGSVTHVRVLRLIGGQCHARRQFLRKCDLALNAQEICLFMRTCFLCTRVFKVVIRCWRIVISGLLMHQRVFINAQEGCLLMLKRVC